MSVTIMEALQNAKFNLVDQPHAIALMIGKEQLSNAVILLEKGYDLGEEVEPLLEKYGSIDKVPEKE